MLHHASMSMTLRLAAVLLAGVGAVAGGCGGRAVSRIDVGSYAFVSGEFTGRLESPMPAALEATDRAMLRAGLARLANRSFGGGGGAGGGTLLSGEEPSGRRVDVRLRPEGKTVRITIAIGNVGDESRSAELFSMIVAELAAAKDRTAQPQQP